MPVELKNLNYSYMPGSPFEVRALKDISMRVEDGEFVGIIGHTGCGKSTLIQQMAGLLTPSSGTVEVDGEDINASGYDRKKLRRTLGVVFQYPEYQLFEETVGKDVAFGPAKAGMGEEDVRKSVDDALALMDFDPEKIRDISPFDLSGGQKRKVAIAGVLATKPRILILDEPIAGLDPIGREQFMQLVRRLNVQGTTIIMISHNMDGLADYATRIIAMDHGEIYMDGTPGQVFADIGKLRAVGLDASEARQAAYLLKQCGWDIPDDIITRSELVDFIVAHRKEDR
ncbi:MAG: energy-coupling factor transporter ATPase [Christensenella sp.]|uniref:energy-coupling factor transporter ATPase n=1 Tax=Christensenella sp. TaxID=1935934 RepID=UPI002B1ECFA1|nr:energy-coupling factor transporter ATPase [Christensenella sp.]MEA5002551.1 energy-coupling factor transporter ATPase [Christensenella sp.]